MDPMRPLAKTLFVPLLLFRNRNREYKHLEAVERAQYLSIDQLRESSLERLRGLLIHARDHCDFYAKRFAQVAFVPEKMRSTEDLLVIPPLTKADIQQHRSELIACNYEGSALIPNQTGGSTGEPLQFYHDQECMWWRTSCTVRHDRWAGLELWDKRAALWGNRRDFATPMSFLSRLRQMLAVRTVAFDTSHITADGLHALVRRLQNEKPSVYVAYAGAVWLLARFIRQAGIIDYHRPRSIITSAEILADDQRSLIEEVFECPVFDRYGCRETSVIASECERHSGMHICADRLHLEFVRGNQPCEPGEVGEILITDLSNLAMPFIRYRIMDMGAPLDGVCDCGRTLPRMHMGGGRATDFLVSPDGSVVSGAAMTIYFIARIPGVAQAQLVQTRRDHLTLRLVMGPGFDRESEKAIAESVVRFFGPSMKHDLEVVERIPPSPSGKLQFSICELDPLEFLR